MSTRRTFLQSLLAFLALPWRKKEKPHVVWTEYKLGRPWVNEVYVEQFPYEGSVCVYAEEAPIQEHPQYSQLVARYGEVPFKTFLRLRSEYSYAPRG